MQPEEVVGAGVDGDRDGVVNELLPGEISALDIFLATMERPFQEKTDSISQRGFGIFQDIGCSDCHRPELQTNSRFLEFSLPELPANPGQNIFYRADLSHAPARFSLIDGRGNSRRGGEYGIAVGLFSDLKRHDMGAELAESFHKAGEQRNTEFITAKLWGVADTAPYLHDGRALTLVEAVRLHGGEAFEARENFLGLLQEDQAALIAFLRTLRNPRTPNQDVQGEDQ